jgi:hypothetical protein
MGINDVQEFTCSTLFLLPSIGLQRKDILKYGFIDAYIDDIHHEPHYEESIYLLFRPKDMLPLQVFIDQEYKRTKQLIEDYDYAGGYVVAVYEIPEEFKPEYNLFLKGKYSRFRKRYTDLFPKMVEIMTDGRMTPQYSLPYHIFNRTDAMRNFWEEKFETRLDEDAEMYSVPDIEGREKLDIYKLVKEAKSL